MRRVRLGLAVIFALGGAIWLPLAAQAHALAQSSNPGDGAILQQAPKAVTITFGETPDPKISTIRILDTSGKEYQQGRAQAVAGNPLQLQVAMGPAPNGVYTVAWRTISSVDGHLASGAFAFGVGTSPAGARRSSAQASPAGGAQPTPLAIAGRWLLFAGLASLVGVAFIGLIAFRQTPPPLVPLAAVAAVVSVVGTAVVIEVQRADAEVPYAQLLATSLGRIAVWRVVPAGLIVVAVLLAIVGRGNGRRVGLGMAGAAAAAGMVADVSASHAAAGNLPLLNGLVQWVHVLGVGVWMGGLLALLVAIRGAESADKARAVKRFSTAAGFALVVVALTGITRAVVEIGAWDRVLTTTFGLLVVAKVSLIVLLAGLGAVNRFRGVPQALRRLQPLRRIGSGEVVLGAGALLTAAGLVNVAPPAYAVAATPSQPTIVAQGSDFGTTVKVRLEVSPGTAGFNQFTLRVTDYDSGKVIRADGVSLKFSLPARSDVGSSSLNLKRAPDGTYQATGTNLSLDGAWRVDVFVQRGAQSTQVTLNIKTRTVPQIDVNRVPGQLTLYTIHLSQGRSVQVYLDPGTAGPNEFHATLFDASGNELPSDNATIAMTSPGRHPQALPLRELEPGHFVADANVKKGRYGFDINATARTGEQLSTHIDVDIGS
jgi:putative copper export protein/methionine-rich copper-binding protein CopC/nitrogen fixation protein FixH